MGILSKFFGTRSRPLPSRSTAKTPFVAASFDRLTASWLATRQSINEELKSDLDRLRDRARDAARNNGYARRFLKMVARNLVGPSGVVLQARSMNAPDQPDTLANAAIEAAYFRWCRRGSAEITGRMSFADACRTVARGVARDGEMLVRMVNGAAARNREGFAIQLIDVARMDTSRNVEPAPGRNAVVMGVEIDEYQRPVAYWIKPKVADSTGAAVRYPAEDILHVYLSEFAEQMRGIPWMHAALLDLHDLGEFNRSALMAARKGADTLGLITTPGGDGTDLADEVDADGTPIDVSEIGTFKVLPEGCDVKSLDAKYPDQSYDPFVKAILRRISSGFDVSYNGLANDLEGVNFSSIRAGVLEERDEWVQLQEWFISAFVEPIYEAWFNRSMLVGSITMPNGSPLPVAKKDKFFAHEWQGRRWTWVDPMKDIQAARLAIQTGVASPQMVAAQNGVDVEDVLNAIAAFEQMASAKGVQSVSLGAGSGAVATGSTPAAESGPVLP